MSSRPRNPLLPILLLFAAVLSTPRVEATTIYADDTGCSNTGSTCGRGANPPCCKIQLAICNAVSGDTIIAKAGTYIESLRMKPGVSVVSEGGPNVTTINATNKPCMPSGNYCSIPTGNGQCSAVIINWGVESNTRLDGFKITGGKGVHEVFGSNPAKTMGGGIFISGNAVVTNNIIAGNSLSGSDKLFYGGGIAIVATSGTNRPQITNNTIKGNKAMPPEGSGQSTTYGFGGGIYTGKSCVPTIQGNIIGDPDNDGTDDGNKAGNKALAPGAQTEGEGGGLYVYGPRDQGDVLVTRNLIRGNSARDVGGGIRVGSYPCSNGCPRTSALITNNEIRGNDAGAVSSLGEGGGVALYKASLKLINNTVHGNSAGNGGGHNKGFQTTGSDPDVVLDANNIYSSNTARNSGQGGGIHALTTCHTIRNTDFWQNTPLQLGGACSDSVIGTNNNRQNDPLYVSATAGNFHLDPSSLLIDAGSDADAPAVDRENVPRPLDGNLDGTPTADIGEYELDRDCDGDGTANRIDIDDDNDGDPDTTDCAACNQNRYHGKAESCNGVDEDCDASIDEGLGQTSCGIGACLRTVNNCVNGNPQTCAPGSPADELCNGIDDNCDGQVDNDADTDGDGIFNCADSDDDGDGAPDSTDCAPLNPSAFSVPVESDGVQIIGAVSTQVSWSIQNSGSGTRYDLATGALASAASNSFTQGTCLANDVPSTGTTDTRANPGAGAGYYYLVRAQNACGTGTYGSVSRDQHGSAGGTGCP